MSKRARTLVMSFLSIVLAIAVLAGGTYALFQTKVGIKGHLVAGNMQLKLERIALNGETGNDVLKDFTSTTDNLFSKNGETPLIVPGGTYSAKLKISHKDGSNVPFTYYVKLEIASGSDATLVDSLTMTLKSGVGVGETVVNAVNFSTEASPIYVGTTGASEFEIIISLPNVADQNSVMSKSVSFDLYVFATQSNG